MDKNFDIAILFSKVERQITLHLEMTRPLPVSGKGSLSYKLCQFFRIVFVIGKCAFIFRVGVRIFQRENFILGWFVRIPLRNFRMACFLFFFDSILRMETLGVIVREFSQGLNCQEKLTLGRRDLSVEVERDFLALFEKGSEIELKKTNFFNWK